LHVFFYAHNLTQNTKHSSKIFYVRNRKGARISGSKKDNRKLKEDLTELAVSSPEVKKAYWELVHILKIEITRK
jgi:hypothetical protein